MFEGKFANLYALGFFRRRLARISAEHDDVEKRVTHKTVPSVNAPYCLTRNEQVSDLGGFTVAVYIDAAVLIVQRRIYEYGFFAYIYAVFGEHSVHRTVRRFY